MVPNSEVTRREFALITEAAALGTGAPGADARADPQPVAKEEAPTRVIDLHTHVFSVLYLPIEGISTRWCEEHGIKVSIGRAVAAILNVIALSLSGTHLTDEELGTLVLRLFEAAEETLLLELFDLTPPQAFAQPQVRSVLVEFDSELNAELDKPFFSKLVVRPSFLRLFHAFLKAIPSYFGTAETAPKAYLRWVRLLVHNEHDIFLALRKVSPSVAYFVHHLMDMQNYYDGGPVYALQLHQIPLMGRLNRENAGHLFGFVAWDPRRPGDLGIVQRALTSGFVGVKFYPPNGYKPLGNAGVVKDGDKIDAANRELFSFCTKEGVPIFAHCTPEGFESRPGYGCFADPQAWGDVIHEFDELRLCLGHAGGEEWWLDGGSNPCKLPPFGKIATDLALRSKRVYCEIAYMNDLRNPQARATFVRHVRELLDKGGQKIEQRLCYGTDWMMPEMFIEGTESYLASLRQAFTDPKLSGWGGRFFFTNAVEYLNLPKFIERHNAYNPGFLNPAALGRLQQMIR